MFDSVLLSSCCSETVALVSVAADGRGEAITAAAARIAAAVVAIRQVDVVRARGAVNRRTVVFQLGCGRVGGIGGNGPFTWLSILE